MNIIKTDLTTLLRTRSLHNLSLFREELRGGKVALSIQPDVSITMKAETHIKDPQYQAIRQYCNVHLPIDSLMLSTHNYGSPATWANGVSDFTLSPNPGTKLIITSIVTRLPEDLDLSGNNMYFKVYKSPDNEMVVTEAFPPAVSDTYTHMRDLLMISNSPVDLFMMSIGGIAIPVMDIKFRYADADTANESKLTLSSRLNEHINITMQNNTQPTQRLLSAGIADPVYAWFNCKRVLDF